MAPGMFMITIFDTAVYIAIGTRLTVLTSPTGFRGCFRAFTSGHGMGRISKKLFVTGQIYYL